MTQNRISNITLMIMVFLISALFMGMIRQFLMAIFMAGLFSGTVKPVHSYLSDKLKGKKNLASILVITGIILTILIPMSVIITLVITQAVNIGQSVSPFVQKLINEPTVLSSHLEGLPFYQDILPYRNIIVQKTGEFVGTMSGFLINSLSSFTKITIDAIFSLIIMLYVMFYFLTMGNELLNKILYFLPLNDKNEKRLIHRFTSVTRATVKGTIIIGIVQGTICGTAFAIAHIQGPVFWGSVMAFASIIPAVGTAIVWVPALAVLLVMGKFFNALILLVLCGLVAGSLDNILRPKLVGKDTQMHDLFVLFGTLGGISMFGILGIIIGPIVAALFITVWGIYGETFQDILPKVEEDPAKSLQHTKKED